MSPCNVNIGEQIMKSSRNGLSDEHRYSYCWDASTNFDAKYVKQCGSAQGSAFGGLKTNIQGLDPHFPQNRHFRAPFRWDFEFFSLENGFNIGRLESKRHLIVVGAQ